MRIVCLLLATTLTAISGCADIPFLDEADSFSQPWTLDDPRGDAPAAADIVRLRIEPGDQALVELELAAPFEDPDGQVQVALEAGNGIYLLTVTLDESFAFHVAPCEGCSASETGTRVGDGDLDGDVATWRFTQEHRMSGLGFGQTLGARSDGSGCRYDLVTNHLAPDMPSC